MAEVIDILTAVKEQGERTERALVTLATELRTMALAITTATKPKNGSWQMLVGVGALIIGLMTPVYIMVGATNSKVDELQEQLVLMDKHSRDAAITNATQTERLALLESKCR